MGGKITQAAILGERARRFAGKSRRPAAADRKIGTRIDEAPCDIFMAIDDREHQGAEPVFGGDVQVGAVSDEQSHHLIATGESSQHQRRLSVPVALVAIAAALEKLRD